MYSVNVVKIGQRRGWWITFLREYLTSQTYQGQTLKIQRRYMMKWGKYPEKFVSNLLGSKGLFILFTLALLLLLSGASDKWGL